MLSQQQQQPSSSNKNLNEEDEVDDSCPAAHISHFAESVVWLDGLGRLIESILTTPSSLTSVESGGEDIAKNPSTSTEKIFEDVVQVSLDQTFDDRYFHLLFIIDKYQEQPNLLDPSLERMIEPIIQAIWTCISQAALHEKLEPDGGNTCAEADALFIRLRPLFRILYRLCKCRGYKTILSFFKHDVSDLEPMLLFISAAKASALLDIWEIRYVSLLWLSLICMIPFDLKTIDSAQKGGKKLVDRIMDLCNEFFTYSGRESMAASILTMRVLTRRDTVSTALPVWITSVIDEINSLEQKYSPIAQTFTSSVLYAFCTILKYGGRESLQFAAPLIFPVVEQALLHYPSNGVVRKYCMKLHARIALVLLKPRVASWRYQRGMRTIAHLNNNVTAAANTPGSSDSSTVPNDREDMFAGYTEQEQEFIEECITQLLNGLSDKDTVVRWTCAKGIGRLSGRLSKGHAGMIVDAVADLLSADTFDAPSPYPEIASHPSSSESPKKIVDITEVDNFTWHGACLAVAELARRGLLLPDQLAKVIPWIEKALMFDQRKGTYSIGSHVRDAACYVCWSFARAYAPEIMKPFVESLAPSLVLTSVTDREVNVRRAASAAFQENVGRQGIFPHGIDIITMADYISLGNRHACFVQIAVDLAGFSEYRTQFLRQLSFSSLLHWDKLIRASAAEALAKLYVLYDCSAYIRECILPFLVSNACNSDLVILTGCLIGLAELLPVCYKDIQGSALEIGVIDVISHHANQTASLDGFGSNLTLQVLAKLMKSCCDCGLFPGRTPESVASTAICWSIIVRGLERKEEDVLYAVCMALVSLSQADPVSNELLDRWISKVRDLEKVQRRASVLGLGFLSSDDVIRHIDVLHPALLSAMTISIRKSMNDAESRKYAIQGFHRMLCMIRSSAGPILSIDQWSALGKAMILALDDYCTDSRGDVGSWSREAVLNLLPDLFLTMPIAQLGNIHVAIVGKTLRMVVEKIDRVREAAIRSLRRIIPMMYPILEGEPSLNIDLPWRRELWTLFAPQMDLKQIDIFSHLRCVLTFPEYRFEFLLGLIVSIGGLSESLTKASTGALEAHISDLQSTSGTDAMDAFFDQVLQVFTRFAKQDRIIIPLLETLSYMFGLGGVVEHLAKSDRLGNLATQFLGLTSKSNEPRRIQSGLVLAGAVASLHPASFWYIVECLGHGFPAIRKIAADQLFLALSFAENEDELEEVSELLLSTEWDILEEPTITETKGQLIAALQATPPAFA